MTDPISRFEQRGLAIGARIGVSCSELAESVHILKGAFGVEWLRAQAEDRRGADFVPTCRHHLGTVFSVAGAPQIVEACEVARYLRTLAGVPGLVQVIKNMKNADDYAPSLMQLSFAARFLAIGGTSVELEPPVAGGRFGDIAFRFGADNYVTECYIPRKAPRLPEGVGELRVAARDLLKAVEVSNDHLSRVVMVRPKRPVVSNERKRVVARARRMAEAIGSQREVVCDDDLVSLCLRRVSQDEVATYLPQDRGGEYPDFFDGAHVCVVSQAYTKAELERFEALGVQPDNRQVGNVLLVWTPPRTGAQPSLDRWMEEVADAISKKLVQARRDDAPRRLAIVGLPEAFDDNEGVVAAVGSIGKRLARKHEHFGGLLIVSRIMWPHHQYGFVGYFVGGGGNHSLPSPAINAMNGLPDYPTSLRTVEHP